MQGSEPTSEVDEGRNEADGMGGDGSLETALVDLLAQGNSEAFVSFFYMGYKCGAADDEPSAEELEEQGIDPTTYEPENEIERRHISYCKERLQKAEEASRKNEEERRFTALTTLGDYMAEQGRPRKAIFLHTQALLAAKDANNPIGEMNAHGRLGELQEYLGNSLYAEENFKRRAHLGKVTEDRRVVAEAKAQLIRVLRARANELSHAGDHGRAAMVLEECVSHGQEMGDEGTVSRAKLEIGKEVKEQGEVEKAATMFSEAIEAASKEGFIDTEAEAAYALAVAQRHLGKGIEAASSLDRFLHASHGQGERVQAEAQCLKGQLEYEAGALEDACNSFETFFQIARALGDEAMTDAARINLGMALGKRRADDYVHLVARDLPNLLSWTLSRTKFPSRSEEDDTAPSLKDSTASA